MTEQAVRKIKSAHPITLYVMCNRLEQMSDDQLQGKLQAAVSDNVKVKVSNSYKERSVAGAWNEGIRLAQLDGHKLFIVMANDIVLEPTAIDALFNFSCDVRSANVGIWSGCSNNDGVTRAPGSIDDGCDFSFFLLAQRTIDRVGHFDENFRPAYFEDNDFAARVILNGMQCRYVHDARFFHHLSATRRNDEEAEHHIAHWFMKNQQYFVRKWGRLPVGDEVTIKATYFQTPFNGGHHVSFWERPV
jgi:GT2 family glycosyltransferase